MDTRTNTRKRTRGSENRIKRVKENNEIFKEMLNSGEKNINEGRRL